MVGDLETRGWTRFGFDPALEAWARAADALTDAAMADPRHAQWWDCEDTWFIGVDALDNDADGTVAGWHGACRTELMANGFT